MARDTTPPTDTIDAELEALDEKDQALLNRLDRFAVLQVQYEAQRKEIETQRRELEREKHRRIAEEEAAAARRREAERLEKEKREREMKEAREKERREKSEAEKREAGRRLSVRSVTRTPGRPSNSHQEKENWGLMSGNDVCSRYKERGEDCYRPVKSITPNTPRATLSLSTPARQGSGQIALEKGMRCRGCRESRKKCSTNTIETATPAASRTETPSSQNAKKRKSASEDIEVGQLKKVKTNLQVGSDRRQPNGGVRTLDDNALDDLEILFTDLVKHQEVNLSIQRQILRRISSFRPPKVFEPYEKEEETDELLLGSDMGYELEYTDG